MVDWNDLSFNALLGRLSSPAWDVRLLAADELGNRGAHGGLSEQEKGLAVDRLIMALSDENAVVRRGVATALGRLGDARAVDRLIWALSDDDVYVRRNAAEALGRLGDARAVDPLIPLLSDKDAFVRRRAAEALVSFKIPFNDKIAGALSNATARYDDEQLRQLCADYQRTKKKQVAVR